MKNNKINKFWTWAFAVICISIFCFAGRQLAYIGNASGADTANISGALRATKALIVRDTFTTKPGDYLQLFRNSTKLTYIDSAGRIYAPELLAGTTTRDGVSKLIVNGGAVVNGWNYGTPGLTYFPTASLYADSTRHLGFYIPSIAGQPGCAKIYAGIGPGSTGSKLVINLFRNGTQNQLFTFDANGLTLNAINLTSSITVPSIVVGAANSNEHSIKFLRSGLQAMGAMGFASGATKFQINLSGNADLASGTEWFTILRTSGYTGINTPTPTSQMDITGANGYDQLRLRTTYTPTSSADANGNNGDVAYDANYIYIKVGGSWKRSALSTF